jgi:ketosteroid isomerase-like protein
MTAKKKAARRKTTGSRKPAQSRPATAKAGRKLARAPRSAAAPARSATPPPPSPAERLARKIVEMTLDPSKLDLAQLYARECRSAEPGREPVKGIGAIEAKFRQFDSMIRAQRWNARHSWVQGDTICIEWEAALELADGRQVRFEEVAVHETRDGKIVEERFYYDPSVLAPPAAAAAAPARAREGAPPIDPIDL